MGILGSILVFIVLLVILVGFHEFGHLSIARANGVFCEVFSLGMGPTIFEKTDKYGTKWRLSLLPIGGYVKMFGDADATSVKEQIPDGYTEEDMEKMSAFRKKPWQRLLIAFGGPLANFVLAIFVLFGLNSIKGVPEPDNVITLVSKDTLAYSSGLRNGDKVVAINNDIITKFSDLISKIKDYSGNEFEISVERNDSIEQFNVKMYKEDNGKKIPLDRLGIMSTGFTYKKVNILQSFTEACNYTYFIATQNIKAIFKIFTDGKKEFGKVGGIISIFKASATSAEKGIADFISMLAMLSIVLGAINLLPIPVLDGGTVLISCIEWIIGRRLSNKFIETIFTVGIIIVGGLMILGLWNDFKQIEFFSKLVSLFQKY